MADIAGENTNPYQSEQGSTPLVVAAQNAVIAINNLSKTLASNFPAQWTLPPAHATSAGIAGQVAYSTNLFYFCYSANLWSQVTGTTVF